MLAKYQVNCYSCGISYEVEVW